MTITPFVKILNEGVDKEITDLIKGKLIGITSEYQKTLNGNEYYRIEYSINCRF